MTVDMRFRLDDFGRRLEVLENELAEQRRQRLGRRRGDP